MRSTTAPRIAHDASVTVEGEAQEPFAARAVNLSVGGMFVESATLLEPGAQVALKVELRDGGAAVDAQGEVVWVRDGDGEAPGMALRFVGLDETSTRRIGRVVAAGRREPSALFKRDVRIRLASLPAPLRAVARDQSEEGLILEAELPWLKLGSEISAELGPGQTRTGRVRWVGLDLTRAGAARLRILVDLTEEAPSDQSTSASPRLTLAGAPATVASDPARPSIEASASALSSASPSASASRSAPASASRSASASASRSASASASPSASASASASASPSTSAAALASSVPAAGRSRSWLRTLVLGLLLVAPALFALWLTTSSRPAPALLPSSTPAQFSAPVAIARPTGVLEVPKEKPAPEPPPPPRHHHRHRR